MKLKGKPFNIGIILIYSLTPPSTEEATDKFYKTLDKSQFELKEKIIIGDLNAKGRNKMLK